ncbi:hypothetical protein SARC_04695 [Sphaeroforma arctica JP610]|uniref:Uncharacterized protein n=1 Tax=Sphaeroforma arctica JP610 TaxID=667725 RepID=A0A0L0G2G3_9EUKA|nr:hypothetical protein SARC_04695 [Sphaeroforma arctica JP610]KNC83024.1 hypothetical protein SARC_04695 [Sphaeroforma arctica JP610]|eukprot:XP_014156926.1 hypothetical protein SARC_04695 [Sphaeroforma arctica JP610]
MDPILLRRHLGNTSSFVASVLQKLGANSTCKLSKKTVFTDSLEKQQASATLSEESEGANGQGSERTTNFCGGLTPETVLAAIHICKAIGSQINYQLNLLGFDYVIIGNACNDRIELHFGVARQANGGEPNLDVTEMCEHERKRTVNKAYITSSDESGGACNWKQVRDIFDVELDDYVDDTVNSLTQNARAVDYNKRDTVGNRRDLLLTDIRQNNDIRYLAAEGGAAALQEEFDSINGDNRV